MPHSLGKNFFNTMRHRRSETVQRSGDFQSKQSQLCKGPKMFIQIEKNNIQERENVCKDQASKQDN